MNKIETTQIPYKTLNTGDKIPVLGIGTFGSDHVSHDDVQKR